jgi:hypothetical protein
VDLDARYQTGKGALHLLHLPGRQHRPQVGYDLAHRRRQHLDASGQGRCPRPSQFSTQLLTPRLGRHHLRLQVLHLQMRVALGRRHPGVAKY